MELQHGDTPKQIGSQQNARGTPSSKGGQREGNPAFACNHALNPQRRVGYGDVRARQTAQSTAGGLTGLVRGSVAGANEIALSLERMHRIEAIDPVGRTIKDRIVFELEGSDHQVTLAELREAHEGFFPNLMGADAALA